MAHKWALKNKILIFDQLLEQRHIDEIEMWLTEHNLWPYKNEITYLLPAGNVIIREPSMTDEYSIADIVSPDAPTTTNAKGGSQSDINVRFDLIDAKAMFEMAKVLDHGAKKYGANNWRKIDVDDHLNHLLMHTYAYLAGDRTDDHLSHILCRATFALGVALDDTQRICDTFLGMDRCVLAFGHSEDHVFQGDEKPWEDNSCTIVGEADTLVDRTVYRPEDFVYVPDV